MLILDLDLFSEPGAELLFSSFFSLTSPSPTIFNFIVTLFASRRHEVRVNLLKVIPAVVEHVGQDFILKTIIPQIMVGLEEENDEIYLGSLISLTILLPILLEGVNSVPDENMQVPDHKFGDLIELCISHCVKNSLSSPDFYFWEILEALRTLLEATLKLVISKVGRWCNTLAESNGTANLYKKVISFNACCGAVNDWRAKNPIF
jgi:hypothetical protein